MNSKTTTWMVRNMPRELIKDIRSMSVVASKQFGRDVPMYEVATRAMRLGMLMMQEQLESGGSWTQN